MTAPKIIFDRSTDDIRVLPGTPRQPHSFSTNSSGTEIKYKLDPGTGLYLWLELDDQWLDGNDIDELIEFLKAVKAQEAAR
jgi:hypothetical protein